MMLGWGIVAPVGITIALLYKSVWPGKGWFFVSIFVPYDARPVTSTHHADTFDHHVVCAGHQCHRYHSDCGTRQGTVATWTGMQCE